MKDITGNFKSSFNVRLRWISFLKLSVALFLSAFSIESAAAPTPAQYDLVSSAISAQLAQQAARVAAATALARGPFFLRIVGQTQLAVAMSELSRLTALKQQTDAARTNGANPPQAAIDLALSQASTRLSISVSTGNFALLALYASQVSTISALNQAIQLGNAATPEPDRTANPTIVTTPVTYRAPTRLPASTNDDYNGCHRRNRSGACYRSGQIAR